MTRHTKSIGTLAGAAVAAAVAWSLGGALGVGVAAGFLFGASVALWGIAHQTRTARLRPERVWSAFGLSGLAKFAGLIVAALVLRFAPAVGEVCDAPCFLIAYGFAAVLVLLLGMPEVGRAITAGTRPTTV